MSGAVAFVASTLPFQRIAKYHRELGVTEVVCATPLLASSYRKGLERLGLSLTVSGLSGGTWSSSWRLLHRLMRAREIAIFHECCWFQIDFLILLSCRKVRYFPTVTLVGHKRISVRELPPAHRLRGFLFSRWFDVYEVPNDGIDGVYYAFAVKERFRKADSRDLMSGLFSSSAGNAGIRSKPVVLVLCSTDQVPNHLLRHVYTAVIDRLVSAGVEVHIKDHPNPAAQLGISHSGAREVDASLPMECLDLAEYSAFLSVASAAVVAGRNHGDIISIARLLPDQYQERLNTRLQFLESLGIKPHTPRSIEALIEVVRKGWNRS